jgi:hypothetical protein
MSGNGPMSNWHAVTDACMYWVQIGDGKAAAVVTFLPHSLPSDNAATVRVLQVPA